MKKICLTILSIILIINIATPVWADLGDNPPHPSTEPGFVDIAVTPSSHTSSSPQAIEVTVETKNIEDGSVITAQLINNNGEIVSGVEAASAPIKSNKAEVSMSIPSGIEPGVYNIKVSETSLNIDDTSTEYIIKQGAQLNITSVTASSSGHTAGSQHVVTLDIETQNVSNGTTAYAQMVDNNGDTVDGVSATGEVSRNNTTIDLTIPSKVVSGEYYIKVSVASISNADTPYTIYPQSNTPQIISVNLSSPLQEAYKAADVEVTVNTQLVEDEKKVTAKLVDKDNNIVVLSDKEIVSNNALITLTVPSIIQEGTYSIKVSVEGIDDTRELNYRVNLPKPIVTTIMTMDANLVEGDIRGYLVINGDNFNTSKEGNAIEIIDNITSEVKDEMYPIEASKERLKIVIPQDLKSGEYKVRVKVGDYITTSTKTFIVNLPSPVIDEINISEDANLTAGYITGSITIDGENFSDNPSDNKLEIIDVNGVAVEVAQINMASNTKITAQLPQSLIAGTYKLQLTVRGDVVISEGVFEIRVPVGKPSIIGLSMEEVVLKEGNISGDITISGENFSNIIRENTVHFITSDNSIYKATADIKSATEDTIIIKIPTGLEAGDYKTKVIVNGESSISEKNITITKETKETGNNSGPVIIPSPAPKSTPEDPELEEDVEEDVDDNIELDEESSLVTLVDMENHWSKSYVNKLVSLNIVDGVKENGEYKYYPDENITRQEFAKLVVKALGIEIKDQQDMPFVDKDNISAWAKPYIGAVYNLEIITGSVDKEGNRYFYPNQNITRAEMATMIGRVLNKKSNKVLDFKDTEEIPTWAIEHVKLSVEKEIINGNPDGTFKPMDNATRGEAAKVIIKLLDTLK